ncbi:MAG: dihydroorotase, partial [Gammaproteobacteria bacterium]|nr:dihydroorotase [Gammaproteobacteria bacterium]
GAIANLCLIDPNQQWHFDTHQQQSHGANICLNNMSHQGRVVLTLQQGRLTWQTS